MPVVNSAILGSTSSRIAGQLVAASLRRYIDGYSIEVTGPDYSTGPISRMSVEKITFYVKGTPGDQFSLDACYNPSFIDAETGTISEPTSEWVSLGVATIPTTGTPVVKQTISDMCFAFRVVRVSGSGDFTVFIWGLL